MSDASGELRRIAWPECFAFTQVFRSFRLAIHWTKLMLAFLGLTCTYLSGRILDGVWPESAQALVTGAGDQSELDVFVDSPGCGRQAVRDWRREQSRLRNVERVGVFSLSMEHARNTVNRTVGAVLAADVRGGCEGLRKGLLGLLWLPAAHPWFAIVFTVIALAIWGFFGGALARTAALHATRDERIGASEALAFARSKFLAFVGAPLMPLAIILVFAVFLFVGGLVGAIPRLGDVLAGVFFILAVLGGFVVAFVLIGAVAGGPLMYPTVAVENSDAFDALSRTFSYVYQRPWRTALYWLTAVIYGSVCIWFVKLFVRIMLWATHLLVGLSMNWGSPSATDRAVREMPKLEALWQGPSLAGDTPMVGRFDHTESLAGMSWLGQVFIKAWMYVVWGFTAAFAVSLFFCAATIIYLLLRREVDATDWEDVWLEEGVETASAGPAPADSGPAKPAGGDGKSLPIVGQSS